MTYRHLLETLDDYALLEDGWDSDGAPPINPQSIMSARLLVKQLSTTNIPAPTIYISGDGEIGFNWRSGIKVASVSWLHEGRTILYLHDFVKVIGVKDAGADDLANFVKELSRFGPTCT